jgi:cytochrome c oxidase cbb3-type subunit 4
MTGWIGAATTVLAFLAFMGIAWLAYSPRYRKQHEADGMIPFLDSNMHSPSANGDAEKPGN